LLLLVAVCSVDCWLLVCCESLISIEVFGLSAQAQEHHAELIERLAVPFPLLSDETLAFQAALKLPTFDAGGAPFLKRLTLFVRDGRIAHAFYPVARPAEHAREVLDWLDEKRRAIAKG